MNDLQNYSNIINTIFGAGTTTFNTNLNHSNNVIGALNSAQFDDFKNNFIERLKRLAQVYSNYPAYLTEIIVQVNEISSEKNWDGAFAELAAFDHFNSNLHYLFEPVKPNVTLSKTKSLAAEMGKQATNLDGFLDGPNIYFDVKCLKDNVNEILEGIYIELKRHLNTNEIHIIAEYALDTTYEDFQTNRRALLTELRQNVTLATKPPFLNSKVITNLSFRMQWGPGVNSGIRTYDPYNHAENFHTSVFKYANKFLKNDPTLIVLVVFPWYNLVVTNFGGSNVAFYRSFARRVFCQYLHEKRKFNSLMPSFNGKQSILTISKHLSGLVILEDDTILSKNPNQTNVKSYVFLNPNARKKIKNSMATTYLNTICTELYDDFICDNY